MDAGVVVDTGRVPWLPRQVTFRELCPESRRVDEASGGDMVGVGVHPVWREEPPRAGAADHGGEACPRGERGAQPSVGEAEILAPRDPECGGGLGGLPGSDLRRSAGCRLTIGKVENTHPQAAREQQRDGAPHAEFGIVGMGRDDECVEHGILRGGLARTAPVVRLPRGFPGAYSPLMHDPSPADDPIPAPLTIPAPLPVPAPLPDLDAAAAHARRTAVLASVESLLGWDEQTMLPPAGGGYRADQVAAVATLVHAARTDAAQRERLHRLEDLLAGGRGERLDHKDRATIQRLLRDHHKHIRLPARLVEETARACIDGQQAWVDARRHSDWKGFAPKLEQIVRLKREQASCQSPELDPYDSLLDDYEPGARSSDVSALFDRLRPSIVQLVRACQDSADRPDDAMLRRHFPKDAQARFVRTVAERIGFDFDRGRLDTSEHPFCSTNGPHDCRLTTRWDEAYLPTALFGVLHEAGHGLYEQGLRSDAFGLPAGEAASLGVHESQSRLWENLVGRSLCFWQWCLPVARQAFPSSLSDSTAESIQRSLLTVRPSLIRVEADEVTYNLHVMLRFDLERALVRGELSVADLPNAWDERCERDFGIRPANAAEGVLQDIHWSAGLIGYFPTYTLGNVYASQLMAAITRDQPDLSAEVAAGRFESLLGWLRERVHLHGRLLDPGPLLLAATGMPVSERWLIESLWGRYGPAHGLGGRPP